MDTLKHSCMQWGRMTFGVLHPVEQLRKRDNTSQGSEEWQELDSRGVRPARYSVQVEFSQPPGWISRAADGRFVLDASSSSDEGGFLYKPGRPLRIRRVNKVTRCPSDSIQTGVYHMGKGRDSELNSPRIRYLEYPRRRGSLRSDGSGQSAVVFVGTDQRQKPMEVHAIYSPRDARFRTSSPGPMAEWGALQNVSDLSSVRHPSSAERSFPSTVLSQTVTPSSNLPTPSYSQEQSSSIKTIHDRYSRELPSLSTIHEQLPYYRRQEGKDFSPTISVRYGDKLEDDRVQTPTYRSDHAQEFSHNIPRAEAQTPRRPRPHLTQTGRHIHHPSPVPLPSPLLIHDSLNLVRPPSIPDIQKHSMHPSPRHPQAIDKDVRIRHKEQQRPLATSSPPRTRPTPVEPYTSKPPHSPFQMPKIQVRQALPSTNRKQGSVVQLRRKRSFSEPQPRIIAQLREGRHHRLPMWQQHPVRDNQRKERSPASSDASSERQLAYTRDQLQEAIGRVRSGALRGPAHGSAPDLLASIPLATDRQFSSLPLTEWENVRPWSRTGIIESPAGRDMISGTHDFFPDYEERYRQEAYGGPSARASLTSGSSGRGSFKPTVMHSRGDSLQQDIVELEITPESFSGSSGFGSKNTSQQNQSSQSGQSQPSLELPAAPVQIRSSSGRRPLHISDPFSHVPSYQARIVHIDWPSGGAAHMISSTLGHNTSLESPISPLHSEPSPGSKASAPDLSIDHHYEWDAVGGEWAAERALYPPRTSRKYQNMEARVAAMKLEFQQFRQRQAQRRRSYQLETVC